MMILTPKEKAEELYNKFNPHCLTKDFYGDDVEIQSTKKCALFAVDEIIDALDFNQWQNAKQINYYQEVKQEIEKL